MYLWFNEVMAGLIPLSYAVLSMCSLLILKISNIFRLFRITQIILILILPFMLMVALGGYINASAVIIWSLLGPIGALLSGQIRQAIYWFIAFLFLVIFSGFLQPYVRGDNNLPAEMISLFFVMNIGTVSFITFLVLNSFVKQKNKSIELERKNRELEISRLEQEVMLRQSEKLATLGRLSAGIAHELNNPASAGLRGSKQLQEAISKLEHNMFRVGELKLSETQISSYNALKDQILDGIRETPELDPLTQSDHEQEIEEWLENRHIEDTWDLATMLVKSGLSTDDLTNLTNTFSSGQLPGILASIQSGYLSRNLLEEIGQGTGRISEIVKSLRSYSYQEEAPLQTLDIHEGLNDTLIMMRSQLKKGITVQREYDQNLPKIQAYANELNQVWTNIIDNAITAMNGQGRIIIKTFRENDCLVVQISDSGAGIPEELQAKIFDPFFTTKPPGEGTGLGLNISYNIVVQKHGGKINVYSRPGETCFEVKLPINNSVTDN